MNLGRFLELLDLLDSDYDVPERLRDRLTRYVDNRAYRAEIVQQLPAQSEPGHLYVIPNDINLYVGAQGGGYRRLPTQAVP